MSPRGAVPARRPSRRLLWSDAFLTRNNTSRATGEWAGPFQQRLQETPRLTSYQRNSDQRLLQGDVAPPGTALDFRVRRWRRFLELPLDHMLAAQPGTARGRFRVGVWLTPQMTGPQRRVWRRCMRSTTWAYLVFMKSRHAVLCVSVSSWTWVFVHIHPFNMTYPRLAKHLLEVDVVVHCPAGVHVLASVGALPARSGHP